MVNFSETETKALEKHFVTSASSSIYALRAECPPEVFGAFGSFFSRNPKDLRNHLVDAINGNIPGYSIIDKSIGIKNMNRLAEVESPGFESPAIALKSGVAKSQSFFSDFYGKYSHKSIANVVWIPFVANNVSQLFARQLAYDQLAFFIEQSTRFVKFDVENLYLDRDIMKSNHSDLFISTLRNASEAYEKFTELAADHYSKDISFEKWHSKQDDSTKSMPDDKQKLKYRRELKAKSFDVARLLLPQAVRTNIAWILDARSTEYDIAAWKGHPLSELNQSAELIEKAGGEIAPSLLKYTTKNSYYEDQYYNNGLNVELPPRNLSKGVNLISYDKNAFEKSLAILLLRNNRSGSFSDYYSHVKSLDFDDKINILRRVTEKRGERDEWVDVEEAFDCISITAEVITDIGAVRDLRRHQKWDRTEGRYTLDNGFYLPEIIKEMGREAIEVYSEVMNRSHDAELLIRKDFPDAVQYLTPMAAYHPIIMRGGLDQFQYIVATRTTPQGHFSYREDSYNLAEAVCKVHPWIIGLQKYPEGKKVQDVVRDAPLKNVLRMYLGETGLHQ